jgi:hypothetical protein
MEEQMVVRLSLESSTDSWDQETIPEVGYKHPILFIGSLWPFQDHPWIYSCQPTMSPGQIPNILSRDRVTVDGVLDWRLDLLTTLTHDSWLQLIIEKLLISTLQIITAHTKSFQSATASNSGDSSAAPTKSSLHRFPYISLPTLL